MNQFRAINHTDGHHHHQFGKKKGGSWTFSGLNFVRFFLDFGRQMCVSSRVCSCGLTLLRKKEKKKEGSESYFSSFVRVSSRSSAFVHCRLHMAERTTTHTIQRPSLPVSIWEIENSIASRIEFISKPPRHRDTSIIHEIFLKKKTNMTVAQ